MNATLLKRLEAWFEPVEGSLTAFSGGIDSALVLYLSKRFLDQKGIGIIADSPSLKRADLEIAKQFCQQFEISLRIIQTDELDKVEYKSNPFNRCYYCKDTLYSMMREIHQADYANFVLLNGANVDDLGDFRPGHQAANEQNILTPLADCGLGKADIRALARYFELPIWDKPASPCLSSRIPYGQEVTKEKLTQIESAEIVLNNLGFPTVRVRHFGDLAKIESPVSEIERLQSLFLLIESSLKRIGFKKVEIDKEGLVSGKLNRAISSNG
tara:strand:- start:27 stop:836 length:810 start_codon:yes stop_codon:yes gene_type:complete